MTTSLLVTAVVAFLGTTVDDVIILTALFVAYRTGNGPRPLAIVAGQYLGFFVILGAALLAAAGLRVVPDRWVGLLGLIPIGLGLWELRHLRGSDAARPPLAATTSRVAALTFASGADNIGVFTPLFRSLHLTGSLLVTALYLVLVGVLCAAGALLGTHRLVVAALGRISHWLVPLVFIGIGVLIVVTSGTIGAVRDAL